MAFSDWDYLFRYLNRKQWSLIKKLVDIQEDSELPSQEYIERVTAFALGTTKDDFKQRYMHFMDFSYLAVQLIHEFAHRIPHFTDIREEDRISLLDGCCSEVMVLRAARRYDPETDSIVFANGQPYTRENYRSACMGDFTDDLFDFCRIMEKLKVDNAEYALLSVMIILTGHTSLLEPTKVMFLQKIYMATFLGYIKTMRKKNANAIFCSFIPAKLRRISEINSKKCASLMRENRMRNPPPNYIPKRSSQPATREYKEMVTFKNGFGSEDACMAGPSGRCRPKFLCEEEESLIVYLVDLQEKYEMASEDDLKRVKPYSLGASKEDCMKRAEHIIGFAELAVERIFEFTKWVVGFDTISERDQYLLMKACYKEILMLKMARRYDPETDSIVFANVQPYTRENFQSACMGDLVDLLFGFCRAMYNLKVNNVEYVLLTAIVIFSVEPSLLEPEQVQFLKQAYMQYLGTFIENNRPEPTGYFERLLSIPVTLQTLGNMFFQQCLALKAQNIEFPPILNILLNLH